MMTMKPDPVPLEVLIPRKLYEDLLVLVADRGVLIEDMILMYLRSLVTASEKARAVSLTDEMPIGKYKGTPLDTLIRVEPQYVAWLVSNSTTFQITPEAHCLLEEILNA
jgi:hypothetical protein